MDNQNQPPQLDSLMNPEPVEASQAKNRAGFGLPKIPQNILGVPTLAILGLVISIAYAGYLSVAEAMNLKGAAGNFWWVVLGEIVLIAAGQFAVSRYLNVGIRHGISKLASNPSAQQTKLDQVSNWVMLSALALAVLSAIVWPLTGRSTDFTVACVAAILLAANPQVIALVVPAAVSIAIEFAASRGIRVNLRSGFEDLAIADLVLFDKTGTLTTGERQFVSLKTTRRGGLESDDELLAVVAGLEQTGDDPVAVAIRAEAEARGVSPVPVKDVMTVPGIGVNGRFNEFRLYAGGPALLTRQKIDIDVQDLFAADALNSQGYTVIYVVRDDILLGYLALSDKTRETSADAVWGLQHLGKKVGLLSGDAHGVGAALASELKLDEVYSEVLPHQKAEVVEKLQASGRVVAMVAHPVIGASAMAQANVGIAFAVDSDAHPGESQLEILASDPELVTEAVATATRGRRAIRANLAIVTAYHLALLPLATGVMGFALNPIIAAALSPLVTLLATRNARSIWGKA